MLRAVHIPRHTWHPFPQAPRSWSFCRWFGHGLAGPHRRVIDTLERQRASLGFVRAYVADPDPSGSGLRVLLSQYVVWLGQATPAVMNPRVVVVDRSAGAARASARLVPGARSVSAALADNLRGCPFHIVLMLDTHAYPRHPQAFDTARQALAGAVMYAPGTAIIIHGAPVARTPFRAALDSSPAVYLRIHPAPAPESARIPANSPRPNSPNSPIQSEKSDIVPSRSRPCKSPPVPAVAATAPQPRTLLRNPSSKAIIDILVLFPGTRSATTEPRPKSPKSPKSYFPPPSCKSLFKMCL